MRWELLRQMPQHYRPFIAKAIPSRVKPPKLVAIYPDFFLIKTGYISKDGRLKIGMFKILDDGTCLPAIFPDEFPY